MMLETTREYWQHMEQALRRAGRDDVVEQPFLEALQAKNYPRFYALLRKLDEPVPLYVCRAALGGTCRAFVRALDHGPMAWKDIQQLAYEAALGDRPEHLAALLERGAQVDTGNRPVTSPLVGALWGRSLKCLEVLLERAGWEPFYPPELLEEWARGETGDTMLDFCLQTIASRWLPEQYSLFAPLPLPPGLKLSHAVEAENWSLTLRMVREGRVTAEDFCGLITLRPQLGRQAEFLPAAAAALEGDPRLLEDDRAAAWLVMLALDPERAFPAPLTQALERLKGREQVALGTAFCEFFQAGTGKDMEWRALLARWEERLGSRPRPALDRNHLIAFPKDLREAAWLLRRCPVVGELPQDRPSPMARWLRWKGSVEMFRAALEPGGALEGENLNRLLDEIPSGEDASAEDRAKRAALLARMT